MRILKGTIITERTKFTTDFVNTYTNNTDVWKALELYINQAMFIQCYHIGEVIKSKEHFFLLMFCTTQPKEPRKVCEINSLRQTNTREIIVANVDVMRVLTESMVNVPYIFSSINS